MKGVATTDPMDINRIIQITKNSMTINLKNQTNKQNSTVDMTWFMADSGLKSSSFIVPGEGWIQ